MIFLTLPTLVLLVTLQPLLAHLCTVAHCTAYGASFPCTDPVLHSRSLCLQWIIEASRTPPSPCAIVCTQECRFPLLLASDGSQHCTLCVLQTYSCQSNFTITGPVLTPPPIATLSPFGLPAASVTASATAVSIPSSPVPSPSNSSFQFVDIFPELSGEPPLPSSTPEAALPCRAQSNAACANSGEKCAVLISPPLQSKICHEQLACVIDNSTHSTPHDTLSGTCTTISSQPLHLCNLSFCTRLGSKALCTLTIGTFSITTSCQVWAKSSPLLSPPDCAFVCATECIVGEAALLASNGKSYCSICELRKVSCETEFVVFGPMDVGGENEV